MKLNKKLVTLNVLAVLLSTETALAKLQGVRTPSAPAASGGSATSSGPQDSATEVKVSQGKKEEASKVIAAQVEKCDYDLTKAKYFPQELFKEITRDGDNISVEVRDGDKVFVKIPPMLNVCGNFVPELRQDKVSRNVSVLMKLIDNDGKELTYADFEDCLKKQKTGDAKDDPNILVDGKIIHDKIPGKYYSGNIYSKSRCPKNS